MTLIAHIDDNRIQTVSEHSFGTAEIARRDLAPFGLSETGYLVGLLHDMGKCSDEFQAYIVKNDPSLRGSVVHSSAGCSYILGKHHSDPLSFEGFVAELVAAAIAAHHGLFDLNRPEEQTSGFEMKINRQPETDKKAASVFFSEVVSEETVEELFNKAVDELNDVYDKIGYVPDSGRDRLHEVRFYLSLILRLVCSALIDADRSDTASFFGIKTETTSPDWESAAKKIEEKVDSFVCRNDIDKARRDFSECCADAADKNSGIYRLNLPTGGGKTLSSLRFSILQARKMNARRVIYVAPLLSIIDQNEEVFRSVLGNDFVLAHHTDLVSEKDSEDSVAQNILRQNWNAPVIATTLVRVLYAMFRSDTSDVRLFHSLGNSVVIFDEVQSVPRNMLSLFNLTCSFIASTMKSVVILCSATQPAFELACRPMKGIGEDIVPASTIKKYPDLFSRTKIIYLGTKTINEISDFIWERMSRTDSFLAVCNKKREAFELFRNLTAKRENNKQAKNPEIFHLSSGMCMAHRKKVLEKIKQNLEKGKKTICVSTQVIESGVDISFSEALRFAAGLDSVIQTTGRCNRNGRSSDPGLVWVVNLAGENLSMLKEISDGKTALLQILYSDDPDLASDVSVENYYRIFFDQGSEIGSQDYPTQNGMTGFRLLADSRERQDGAWFFGCSPKTAGNLFRVFDENTKSIIVPYGKGKFLARQLASEKAEAIRYRIKLMKDAVIFSVSIREKQFEQLQSIGAITTIEYQDGTSVFVLDEKYYDLDTGLKEIECTKTTIV